MLKNNAWNDVIQKDFPNFLEEILLIFFLKWF